MKAKTIICALVALLTACGISSCRSKQEIPSTYAAAQFPTTWIRTNGDGTLTLRAWGQGSTSGQARAQAMKNAVSDVIFKGVGTASYDRQALVTEVNARERYQDYFDRFFADGGEYARFVKEASTTDGSQIHSKNTSSNNRGIVVVVNRAELRRQLVDDGILAQ